MIYRHMAKPLLFKLQPETAHHLVIGGLKSASHVPGVEQLLARTYRTKEQPALAVRQFGLRFSNPIGLAAGLDKNAEAVRGFSALGFGFIEVGTVTPKGQPGNEKPRSFRLPPDEALINRMGFNNEGAEAMARRLERLGKRRIPIAVNIGKNKSTPNEQAPDDYRACIQALYPYGDFFVVNISSPNTPGLRNLQHGDDLSQLLAAVLDEMEKQHKALGYAGEVKPVLVKIAPDLENDELGYTLETIAGSGVSGLIATNTTLSREGLRHSNREEAGGLSGKPLRDKSTAVIREAYRLTGGKLPIIGSGGIFAAADAYEKIRAGASLVEVYTAFIYHGPGLIKQLNEGLAALMKQDGFASIAEAVGADHR
ncbi:quinone-dependent dihydroorotate dehydrogenase [Xylanibacillus composti]|uniref:Dihydroorotate dehydrogenase (quinone) n=1 Tax=Xylanibacillus composti TaxID=1572762 RepID=A0A8J4H2G8_9BACL|nr:quinone-dependent dihydroorotate dehydrogenase [Xylanibacillus composti]MDT9724990.1 quinone-dependent dihydroorotate dehydrogenase [Xylanibacillus composti]GIQ68231.1 dihydroorotate dehydrogenase (quinone) [Xylanibacillus composti]